MICKNCGHELKQRKTGWCVHVGPKKFKLGKNFFIPFINKVVIPIRIKNVIRIPIIKNSAYFQLLNNQKEKRYKNTNIIPATIKLALRDFSFTDSSIRSTRSGETYQVLNKGIKANITDINMPKTIPRSTEVG